MNIFKKVAFTILAGMVVSIAGFVLPLRSNVAAANSSPLWLPTADVPIHWQWQLSTDFVYPTQVIPNVTVYDLDWELTSTSVINSLHSIGCKVIAYIEIGDYTSGRYDSSQFTALDAAAPTSSKILGNQISGFSDKWIDIRASNPKSAQLRALLQARMQLAKDKGFDAIEPDCINAYGDNSGFPITAADQLEFNKWVAATAHAIGLSVCLKSDVDQATALEPYFDFVLDEESYNYGQLGDYGAFLAHNKAVLNCEYANYNSTQLAAWKAFCQTNHIDGIRRNVDLTYSGVRDPAIPDTWSTWTGTTGTNQPPVLAAIGPKSATVGQSLQFNVSATDPNGDTVTFSASGLPSGATFSNGCFLWKPSKSGT